MPSAPQDYWQLLHANAPSVPATAAPDQIAIPGLPAAPPNNAFSGDWNSLLQPTPSDPPSAPSAGIPPDKNRPTPPPLASQPPGPQWRQDKMMHSLLTNVKFYGGDANRLISGIDQASSATQVDPNLIKAIIMAESSGNPRETSSTNAQGLMQLMPDTWRERQQVLAKQGYHISDRMDPRDSILAGTSYIKSMMEQFPGNLPYAIAAYNAGPGNVRKYHGIPHYRETENYVNRVMQLYHSMSGPHATGLVPASPAQ